MSIMSSDRERRSIVQGESIVGPFQQTGRYQTCAIERESLGSSIVARVFGSRVDVKIDHAEVRMQETRSDLHATVLVDGIRESDLRTAVP